jgi:hypothetical protein
MVDVDGVSSSARNICSEMDRHLTQLSLCNAIIISTPNMTFDDLTRGVSQLGKYYIIDNKNLFQVFPKYFLSTNFKISPSAIQCAWFL